MGGTLLNLMRNLAVFASLLKGRRDVGELHPPGLPTFTLRAESATFSEIYVDVTDDPDGG